MKYKGGFLATPPLRSLATRLIGRFAHLASLSIAGKNRPNRPIGQYILPAPFRPPPKPYSGSLESQYTIWDVLASPKDPP